MFGSLAVVCCVTFLTRSLFRLWFHREVRSADTYFHLKMALVVGDLGWKRTSQTIKPDYPLGYHFLLSFLPQSRLPVWERINGAVFDTLHVVLFVAVFSRFAGPGVGQDVVWFWAPLLLALSPAWLYVGSAPRAYDGTERVFGELLTSCVFSALWFFEATGSWYWWLLAVAIASFLLNTSKFCAQVLVSFCLILAVLERSLATFLVPWVAILGALIISQGTYWNVLKGHVRHLWWYAKALRSNRVPVGRRNSWSEFTRRYRERGPFAAIKYLLLMNSIVIGVVHHVPLVIAVAASLWGVGEFRTSGFAFHWLLAGVAMWLLSSTRWFLFIGEAERYLYNAAIPVYYLIGTWIATVSSTWWLWLILIYSLGWWLGQQIALWRQSAPRSGAQSRSARQELVSFLRSLPQGRLLTFGGSRFMWEMAYYTDHEHFLINPRVPREVTWDKIFAYYPYYPKWEAVRLLDINLVAVQKSALAKIKRRNLDVTFPFGSLAKLFENEEYAVYRIAVERMEEKQGAKALP